LAVPPATANAAAITTARAKHAESIMAFRSLCSR
jgi:hypothetical protein